MGTKPVNDATRTANEQDFPSNWGRWGTEDELGTLNLLTEEARTGRAVSLAQPVRPAPLVSGPFAPTTRDVSPVQQLMLYTGGAPATADVMLVTSHHVRST
ncbi:hypothetical protein GCM10010211_53050 [Streptomyces albospinus]|uniref:Cyclase family protein n=1 Tax=Streptomyces albospinus TaxID=285515 RepID=A0ABQ2VD78_9ACTN|nr:hypothetical protein [Streptomyces albospinus]GGU80268.1 hypothetical protein GCM10010211_53050 [Streptomyces albospinus]